MSKSVFARQAPISIKINVCDTGNKKIIWNNEDAPPEEFSGTADAYEFVFRWPNWQDEVYIQDESMVVVGGTVKLNATKIRYRRFERLLSSLKDHEGNELVKNDILSDIDPDVAEAVMDRLDKVLGKS